MEKNTVLANLETGGKEASKSYCPYIFAYKNIHNNNPDQLFEVLRIIYYTYITKYKYNGFSPANASTRKLQGHPCMHVCSGTEQETALFLLFICKLLLKDNKML